MMYEKHMNSGGNVTTITNIYESHSANHFNNCDVASLTDFSQGDNEKYSNILYILHMRKPRLSRQLITSSLHYYYHLAAQRISI